MNIEWNEIWANIVENWDSLIYLAGLIFAIVFRGKKTLTKEEKLQTKLIKAEQKSEKKAKEFQKSLEEKEKIKKEIEKNVESNKRPKKL